MTVENEVSEVILTPSQIETLPSLGEKDIFRAFQLLPGISGSNETSSGLYVRGGTPDQNLILYDGFTVPVGRQSVHRGSHHLQCL